MRQFVTKLYLIASLAISFAFCSVLAQAQAVAPAAAPSRVLILHATLGNGHKTAAEAIQQQIKDSHPETVVVMKDIFDFYPPEYKSFRERVFNFMAQSVPAFYDLWFKFYLFTQSRMETTLGAWLRQDQLADNAQFRQFVESEKPDLVFSTFNHCTEALIKMKKRGQLKNIPIGSTLTDYISHPYYAWIARNSEMTFVPSQYLHDYYVNLGVAPNRIRASAIPTHPSVSLAMSEKGKADFLVSEGLDPQRPTLFLVSGSAGVGNFSVMVKSIAEASAGRAVNLVVVAGRNEKQRAAVASLAQMLPPNINLKLYGLVPHPKMLNFMKSATVIVTKSGGLSVTEISVINKPVIYLDINGGQERFNADFFRETGMAWTTKVQRTIGQNLFRLLDDPETQARMIEAQKEMIGALSTTAVSEWIIETLVSQESERPAGVNSASSDASIVSCSKVLNR